MIIDKNMCISFFILNPIDNPAFVGKEHFQRTFNDSVAQAKNSNNSISPH